MKRDELRAIASELSLLALKTLRSGGDENDLSRAFSDYLQKALAKSDKSHIKRQTQRAAAIVSRMIKRAKTGHRLIGLVVLDIVVTDPTPFTGSRKLGLLQWFIQSDAASAQDGADDYNPTDPQACIVAADKLTEAARAVETATDNYTRCMEEDGGSGSNPIQIQDEDGPDTTPQAPSELPCIAELREMDHALAAMYDAWEEMDQACGYTGED